MEEQKKNYTLISTIIVLVLAAGAYGIFKFVKKDSGVTQTPIENTTTPPVVPPVEQTTSYLYKDGTYSSIGNYVSPGGDEELAVQVTLKNDIIVDANVVSKAFRPNSIQFQGMFVANYKPLVIGKNIDDVNLTKVSGSSLAPKGFNNALDEIKAQARV